MKKSLGEKGLFECPSFLCFCVLSVVKALILDLVTGERNDPAPSSSSSEGLVQHEFQITLSYMAQPIGSPSSKTSRHS